MSKPEFCRTCFSTTSLLPIFNDHSDCEEFVNDLFITTGIKIVKNDTLSQLICSECNSFIKKSIEFRKKCKETNEKLLKLLNDPEKQEIEVKVDKLANNRLLSKLDTDDYVEMEGTFNEFIEKVNDDIFIDEKRQKKTDPSFIKVDKMPEGSETNQCPHCPKVFMKRRAFMAHQRTHKAVKAICQYCGKALKNEKALLVHCKAMHGYEKTDKCRFCDFRGSRPDLVKVIIHHLIIISLSRR
ncbi:uncharacterized protein [Choristoneura fumiferana]|uniref:uncharacterized protein n=1 Tax=Choristoneura fumiferana TaxID=7141 RepID=UPI003D153BAC